MRGWQNMVGRGKARRTMACAGGGREESLLGTRERAVVVVVVWGSIGKEEWVRKMVEGEKEEREVGKGDDEEEVEEESEYIGKEKWNGI